MVKVFEFLRRIIKVEEVCVALFRTFISRISKEKQILGIFFFDVLNLFWSIFVIISVLHSSSFFESVNFASLNVGLGHCNNSSLSISSFEVI
jgi:hypothetical protein